MAEGATGGDQSAVELQDVGGTDHPRRAAKQTNAAFYVTKKRAILLALVAVAISVLAGVVGHFVFPRKISSAGQAEKEDSYDLLEQCRQLSAARNICLSHNDGCSQSNPSTSARNKTNDRPLDKRLPLKVVPLHYVLELTPDIYTSDPDLFSLRGHVTINVQCRVATDVITLHVNKLRIEGDVTLMEDGPGVQAPMVRRWSVDEVRQFLLIELSGSLAASKRYVLDIRFRAPIQNDLTGLYWSSYTAGGKTRYMATTQMQPTDARKAFPCFDEPAVKATFDVTLLRRPNMTSLANAPKLRTEQRSDGWQADIFDTTLKMSTYLLAFVVCDFQYSERYTSAGTRVRVWSRPEAVEQTTLAVDVGTRTINFYEQYFGIPFPLSKQDMIAVPDFLIGAMENWGLITYREQGILYKTDVSSASDQQWLVELIVHELAHQWFGNLVTPSWWDDLWLNEGFASYMEYIAMDHLYPEWKMNEQFLVRDLHVSLDIDSLVNSHPIYVPVNDPDEINEIFDIISYLKGASIIRMMNHFLGDEIFTSALSNYLSDYAYGNANHSNLWQHLTDQAKRSHLSIDVSDIMNTWVRQTGYPVVTMERLSTQVKVRQQRFLKDPEQSDPEKYISPYGYRWNVPLTYAEDTSQHDSWHNPTPVWFWRNETYKLLTDLDSGAKWFVGNVGQYGYYRVNYDSNNWQALITQLKANHSGIPVKNRAQIIDDSIKLGRSGYLDQLVGMRVTEYLDREMNYVPWKSAVDGLHHVDDMLKFTKYYGHFKRYMLSKLVPVYDVVGFDYSQTTQSHLDKYRRVLICEQTCYYGHKPCNEEALTVFRQWMRNPDSTVLKPDQRSVVFCNAIRHGNQAEWDFLYQYYRHTKLAAEAKSVLHALACSNEPWILNRYLHFALDENKIRRQDGLQVIRDVARNAVGSQLAWNFYRENWPTIKDTWGNGFGRMSVVIEALTASFNTEFQLQQLIEFVEANDNLGAGLRAFDQAIEVTRGNVRWMKRNVEKVGEWLQDR